MTGDPCGRGRAGGCMQDRPRATDVGVHAGLGDPEKLGDLLRRPPGRDGAQDLALAVGQRLFDRAAVKDAPGKQIASDETEKKRRRALPMHREGERPRLAARALARAL